VPEDHVVWTMLEAVGKLDLSGFYAGGTAGETEPATGRSGPCSYAVRPPDRADRGDWAQVLDQHPVDGESALA